MDHKAVLFNLENIIHNEIDNKRKKKLCFRENLLIGKIVNGSNVPVTVGGMCLDVTAAIENKFIVYVNSKFDVDGKVGGSKITAWLDSNFHTIEEKRMEFLAEQNTIKQELYIGIKNDKYHMRQQYEVGAINEIKNEKYNLQSTSQLICEGANFVIMRLLAQYCFLGKFEMSTLYINGDLCRNLYECHGVESGIVNNKKLIICKIRRIIIEECGIIHECMTVLTSTGHIIKQEWKGCNYILQINPLTNPDIISVCGCDTRIETTSLWEDDIHLLSEYLDRQKFCQNKIDKYLKFEPYLQDLLADYVKSLLQQQPTNVLEYTSKYFSRYSVKK